MLCPMRRWMSVVSWLSIVAFVGLALADAAPPKPKMSKAQRDRLGQLVDDLVEEARASWQAERAWPAEPKPIALQAYKIKPETVAEALLYRLHETTAVDGYLKLRLWEALEPDDSNQLSEAWMDRAVQALPAIVPQPDVHADRMPRARSSRDGDIAWIVVGQQRTFISDLEPVPDSRGFDPTLSVVNTGAVLAVQDAVVRVERDILIRVKASNARLSRACTMTDQANGPCLAYREALVATLPRADGRRLLAMTEDLTDRVRAGDPSVEQAIEPWMQEVRAVAADTQLSPEARGRLIGAIERAGQVSRDVLVGYTASDGAILPEYERVRLDQAGKAAALMAGFAE